MSIYVIRVRTGMPGHRYDILASIPREQDTRVCGGLWQRMYLSSRHCIIRSRRSLTMHFTELPTSMHYLPLVRVYNSICNPTYGCNLHDMQCGT